MINTDEKGKKLECWLCKHQCLIRYIFTNSLMLMASMSFGWNSKASLPSIHTLDLLKDKLKSKKIQYFMVISIYKLKQIVQKLCKMGCPNVDSLLCRCVFWHTTLLFWYISVLPLFEFLKHSFKYCIIEVIYATQQ